MGTLATLPLCPLHTVLFPGARLRLRVFERRYLDMVRDCGRSGTPFGVCLILQGREAGAPATPAAVGTCTRIADFATGPDGLLALSVEGDRRFHVERVRVRDNGLIVAQVRLLESDAPAQVAPQHGLLAKLLEHLLERLGALPDDARQLDDASWVGWRLGELLPLDSRDRQLLLQLDDPGQRLDRLTEWLPRLQAPS